MRVRLRAHRVVRRAMPRQHTLLPTGSMLVVVDVVGFERDAVRSSVMRTPRLLPFVGSQDFSAIVVAAWTVRGVVERGLRCHRRGPRAGLGAVSWTPIQGASPPDAEHVQFPRFNSFRDASA